MVTKYGLDVFLVVAGICGALALLALLFVEPRLPKYGLILLSVVFFGFTLNFFRDPDRTPPVGERNIISPADGKVIVVKKVMENEFFKSEAIQISIFMSPLNVHVNRNPITGKVTHYRYVEGEYFAAFEDKASERNEQSIVGMENGHGRVLFKQIAGFIARRIVCHLNIGDSVVAGERFGMIKFGSRVDVFVPVTASIHVKVGDRPVAGETILAQFN